MGDNVGIPEDLRCKRSDGKQWRCNALSMPDKTVCEKHYIQAKKRAANSALRASLKKARRKSLDDADIYLESRNEEQEMKRSMSPMNVGSGEFSGSGGSLKKYKEKVPKGQTFYSPEMMAVRSSRRGGLLRPSEEGQRDALQIEENRGRFLYNTPLSASSKDARCSSGSGAVEYYGKSSDSSGEAEGLTCHQCRRNDRANVVWCVSCDRKGYCDDCISRWYAEILMEDIRKVCPACRGICTCRFCLRGDNLIKAKVQEIAAIDKLRYLHSLLSFALPMLKQIYAEQCFEIGVETRVYGPKADIPRAKINADEQMCCDFCKIPIFDYHRHCMKCSYDLCLTCCRDLRRPSSAVVRGNSTDCRSSERSKDVASATMLPESSEQRTSDKLSSCSGDENAIDFVHLFPNWKAGSDGSIPCAPVDAGGCGSSKLVLRRIFKINWVAKLVKIAEEMVNGCKVHKLDSLNKCAACTGSGTSDSNGLSFMSLRRCSNRDDNSDSFLYFPASHDMKHEGVTHFQRHWVKGEPIVVRHAFERPLALSWDPLSIWKGIQETREEQINENNIVTALDFLNQIEIDIDLHQFIKGYSEGRKSEDGRSQMLQLKEWPPDGTLEEFILCQRPEFLVNFPMIEFIHSKWGILNLAAKLPHDSLQTEFGPKLFITYGTHEELGSGDPVTNLQINMGDQVYLLMHTAEVSNEALRKSEIVNSKKKFTELNAKNSTENVHVTYNVNLDGMSSSPDLTSREHSKEKECGSGLSFKEENMLEKQGCGVSGIASLERNGHDFSLSDKEIVAFPKKAHAAAVWDVFRRQDVPKLNEYLRVHWKEFTPANLPANVVKHPVYDQAVFLTKDHKRILKEEFRIEPWTFEQQVGDAVFIPAGCPFQVRHFQSSVQLALDFLSPESLTESASMAQEIRCLPNDHEAKLKMLEQVGKITLYGASSAIREIQRIALDPKLSNDIKFEDRNLTALVAENLENMRKRRQVVCS